jgi:hypothetical protein
MHVKVPLTRFQEIMYEKSIQSMPTSRFMQLAVCVEFHGMIDPDIFERAAIRLTSRHPILSARLDGASGDLAQRYSDSPPSFEVIDVGTDDHLAVAALVARADEPIDLFRENPFKIVLGLGRPDVTFLLLVGHHVFIDDFSLQQLLAEYVELVVNPAHADGDGPASWDNDDSSFFSWCLAQAGMLRDGSLDKNKRYWLDYLDETDPVIHFPGRPRDPDFQDLATVRFELTPAEMQRSLRRAAQLRVSHFAMVVGTIFHVLSREACQESITSTIIYNARRPPFGRTIGQFAESFLLKQIARDGALADERMKLAYGDIIKAVKNYVSYSHFADNLPWLVDRRDKDFSSTDVRVNYIPRMPALDSPECRKLEVSYVPLTGRMTPKRPTYYGVVMSFTFRPVQDSLWGHAQYETSLVSPQLAQAIMNSIRSELAR